MIKVFIFYSKFLGEVQFHSSSPDEIALVEFAKKEMGINMISRSKELIQIEMKPHQDFFNEDDENLSKKFSYEVLDIFPFSSARKRMSIILK